MLFAGLLTLLVEFRVLFGGLRFRALEDRKVWGGLGLKSSRCGVKCLRRLNTLNGHLHKET